MGVPDSDAVGRPVSWRQRSTPRSKRWSPFQGRGGGISPETREAVRRAVRAAVNAAWGKKPICTVFVSMV